MAGLAVEGEWGLVVEDVVEVVEEEDIVDGVEASAFRENNALKRGARGWVSELRIWERARTVGSVGVVAGRNVSGSEGWSAESRMLDK